MSGSISNKLHVKFTNSVSPQGPITPRAYTLTHSDTTGELFLTVGSDVNQEQISGWYTRFMRDEVVAEWRMQEVPQLHVHCHVSGGWILGTASWREAIFRRHLPMVLEAFGYGDRRLLEEHPELEASEVVVHFHAKQPKRNRTESWGRFGDYRRTSVEGPQS
ncbi:MAG: staygreen family protein [Anaerolineales bacterium]|jgi:hypothetical protein